MLYPIKLLLKVYNSRSINWIFFIFLQLIVTVHTYDDG